MTDYQTQTGRLAYTLKHNNWNNPSDKFKLRVMRELHELSERFDQLESARCSSQVEQPQ